MPTFTRKMLRQDLARGYLRDMPLPPLATLAANQPPTGVGTFQAARWINPGGSGQNLLQGAWVYAEASWAVAGAAPTLYQYTVGSYHVGTGQFLTNEIVVDYHLTNVSQFEIHTRLAPADKDAAIDDVIRRVRLRQEVGIQTTQDLAFYPLDGAASPYQIAQVEDVYYFANPTGTLSRDVRRLTDFRIVTTPTGNELRILPTLAGSQLLVLDAILTPTLGGELATINLPDERWVLAGAAAQCYHLMIQGAPGQQVDELTKRRAEWAGEFTRLSSRYAPLIERKIRLGEVGE